MSSKISLWVGLIGAAATIPLVQTVAVTKSAVEINEIAKAVTVSISSSESQGSGVIIQHKGDLYTVLTASYVVKNRASYQITTLDNRRYEAIVNSIKYVPGDTKLAIIQFRSTINYQNVKLGNSHLIKAGMELYVAGFPANGSTIPVLSVIKGKVIANSNKPFIQDYSLIYDNNTQPGMGGGAVLNTNGELVAIHAIGDRNADGVKTGFQLGTKIERFSAVASQMGVELIALNTPSSKTVATAKSPVEINRIAKAITVSITSDVNQGSGVILQHQGDVYTVLTAAHVVRKKVNYKITTPDNRQYQAIGSSIQIAPGDIDLAVVKFKAANNYTTAELGNCNSLEGGMNLYVAGFPIPDELITSLTFMFREGKVTANSNKIFANGYSLIYSNDTLAGMSGGAVLNIEGELVAIHGKGGKNKDKDGNNAEKNGYNAGISINRFQTVASKMGVKLDGQVAMISQDTSPKADDYLVSAFQKGYQGDIQGALADFERAIQLNPNYAAAYFKRGVMKHDRLNDRAGAINDMKQAARLYQQQGDTQLYQSAIYELKEWQQTSGN